MKFYYLPSLFDTTAKVLGDTIVLGMLMLVPTGIQKTFITKMLKWLNVNTYLVN